jgi:hypothetical protein
LKDGYGKIVFENGGYYSGYWKSNKMNGIGSYSYYENILYKRYIVL